MKMNKIGMLSALAIGLSCNTFHGRAYEMKDIFIDAPPKPQTKRGKFKRRNKGRK